MRIVGAVCLAALCAATLVACAPGNSQTDKDARLVAEEIDSPPQDSAAKYARKALETTLGGSFGFAVIEMRDTTSDDPDAVTMHLIFQVHGPGNQDVGFNFRGSRKSRTAGIALPARRH